MDMGMMALSTSVVFSVSSIPITLVLLHLLDLLTLVSLLGNVNEEYYGDADILGQLKTTQRLSTVMEGLE